MRGIYLQKTPLDRGPEQARTACKGKIRYRFMSGAIIEAKRLRREKSAEVGPLSVYACEFCKGWHVGKATKIILSRLRVVAP